MNETFNSGRYSPAEITKPSYFDNSIIPNQMVLCYFIASYY